MKKAFYKKWWFWVIVIFAIGVISSSGGTEETTHSQIQLPNQIQNQVKNEDKNKDKNEGVYALFSRSYPFFDDYDNKRITGHMVRTSYSEIGIEDFTYLIHTNAMSDNVNSYAKGIEIDGMVYTNYGTAIKEEYYSDLDDKTFSVFNPFMPDKSYNNNISNWTDSNCDEFISSTSVFYSELLRNANGVVVGLIFTEEKKENSQSSDNSNNVSSTSNYNQYNLIEYEYLKDYDNTIVTGTMVKSAYQNFFYKPLAILVHTKEMGSEHFGWSLQINGLTFINYNAQLNYNSKEVILDLDDNIISVPNVNYFADDYGFAANMAIPGKADINGYGDFENTTKFDASLVKAENGEVYGIMFIEKY